jgi:GTP-binding protein
MPGYPHACFLGSAHRAEEFLPDAGAEVAFAGRSNAGKSSAINAIVSRRELARTSKTPGRTQLVNFFGLDDRQRLVDLPGYGYARVPRASRDHWCIMLTEYFGKRRSLAGVFLVVDIRRGLGEGDRQMLAWADAIHCPVHVLLTKADRVSGHTARQTLQSLVPEGEPRFTAQLFSARSATGLTQARERLAAMLTARLASAGHRQR